jgi:phosphatidylglycerophosphate synthase
VSVSPSEPSGLAFKAYEIEELVDIYFYRRFGIVVAHGARAARLSPNAVSVLAGLIGGAGGAMLASDRLALAGVGFLVLHGIFDSADGQLARITKQTSDLGRLLDGVAGYVTHTAAYLGIVAGVVSRGGSWTILAWGALAGVSTAIHAQMYDYHRTSYATIAVKGVAPARRDGRRIVMLYESIQRRLAGVHPQVEAVIAQRASGGCVRENDRANYRRCFYRPVRVWNLFGDNVRRYAFGVFAVAQHLEWMFPFILVPMNLVLMSASVCQRRADRGFLAAIR